MANLRHDILDELKTLRSDLNHFLETFHSSNKYSNGYEGSSSDNVSSQLKKNDVIELSCATSHHDENDLSAFVRHDIYTGD
jgi:hypothetical protein